jgi:hypothetical protein
MHSPATANKHHISPNNVITPSDNTEYDTSLISGAMEKLS